MLDLYNLLEGGTPVHKFWTCAATTAWYKWGGWVKVMGHEGGVVGDLYALLPNFIPLCERGTWMVGDL